MQFFDYRMKDVKMSARQGSLMKRASDIDLENTSTVGGHQLGGHQQQIRAKATSNAIGGGPHFSDLRQPTVRVISRGKKSDEVSSGARTDEKCNTEPKVGTANQSKERRTA